MTDDLRDNKSPLAHSHIVRGDSEGDALVNSRPPQSVAEHQTALNGYDPTRFFDQEHAAKKVEGVSRPQGDGRYVEPLPEIEIEHDQGHER